MTELKIAFFGDENCGVCRGVLSEMEEKGIKPEMTLVPLMGDGFPDRAYRLKIVYEGELFKYLKGKTFGEIFEDKLAIPKMIVQEGDDPPKKLYGSSDMHALLSEQT